MHVMDPQDAWEITIKYIVWGYASFLGGVDLVGLFYYEWDGSNYK